MTSFTRRAALALAGGLALAAAVAVVVLLDPGARATPRAAGAPFYLEMGSTFRWWYQSNDRWRWEVGSAAPVGARTYVDDGTTEWTSVAGGVPAYTCVPAQTSARTIRAPAFLLPIGPVAAPNVRSLIDHWPAAAGALRVVGHDRMLGRAVDVLEYRATADVGLVHGPPPGPHLVVGSGVGRLWVDPETMVILRARFDPADGGPSLSETVTRFEQGVAIDPALFASPVPAGATVAEPAGACAARVERR